MSQANANANANANARSGDFKWGNKRGVGARNAGTQFYDSFFYDGVQYSLFDCVYFSHNSHVETSIGKLVKIYERPGREKMVKVVWFFRPTEIRKFLGSYQPHWNELFLASGVGKGLSNVNFLEAIMGKCSVVCTSADIRNPKPSETELETANFFFKCSFDVDKLAIIDKFPDEIDRIKVEEFFNKKGDKRIVNNLRLETNKRPRIVIKSRTNPSVSLCNQVKDKDETRTSEIVSPRKTLGTSYKKRKFLEDKSSTSQTTPKKAQFEKKSTVTLNNPKKEECKEKEVLTVTLNTRKKGECKEEEDLRQANKVIEVSERPDAEKRRWFKNMPWGGRLQKAQKLNTLVLLSNLDPSYTSYEVEDLVWHTLTEKVEARMIEWSPTSSTHYGMALVIFRTKDAAELAVSELTKRCLILEDGRVVCAWKPNLRDLNKQGEFFGHWTIDRAAFQKKSHEMRNAVSTSHCSQPNTIEYPMAIEWMHQNAKSDASWNALNQRQMKEIADVKSKLKMDFFKTQINLT